MAARTFCKTTFVIFLLQYREVDVGSLEVNNFCVINVMCTVLRVVSKRDINRGKKPVELPEALRNFVDRMYVRPNSCSSHLPSLITL